MYVYIYIYIYICIYIYIYIYIYILVFLAVVYQFHVLHFIMVFSTRIFRNLDLGIEWVFRCKTMELESLRCIISHLERVVA